MKSCLLISVFCLLTSVGLGYDVGVDTILVPSGTVDSGQPVTPRCAVHAYTGSGPVEVHFMIPDGAYHDSLTLPPLPPGLVDTVTFGSWIPRGRDSMTAIAWTECAGDTFPANDTFRQQFLVRVWDIAVIQMIMPPPDTVFDSGAVFYPSCRLWDYGNGGPDTCIVGFRIGEYYSACTLSLRPWPNVVTAPDSYVAMPGIWACSAKAYVRGDLHPENNIMVDTFTVRGPIHDSLWVRALMPDTVYVGDTITPCARAGSCGNNGAIFWLYLSIGDSAGPEWWAESSQVMLNPGDSTDIEFPTLCFTEPGAYLAVAMAYNGEQTAADSHYFWVVPRPGVGETANGEGRKANGGPSVLHRLPPGAVVFDATGRRVASPKPGVYFVRAVSGKLSAVSCRKVILQR